MSEEKNKKEIKKENETKNEIENAEKETEKNKDAKHTKTETSNEEKDIKNKVEKTPKKQKKKKLHILFKIVIILAIILGIILGLGYWYINYRLMSVNFVEIDVAEIEVTEGIEEKLDTYRNIVILGIDTRQDTFTGSRSDSIIIASLNETTKEIDLVSVYRDCYLEIPGYGLDKVNHAYAYGGPALTMSTLNTNLDLNITEFVTVNFDSVKTIIESIGGITLEIDADEVSHIDGISEPGIYNLTGAQALQYSRIRYAEGGDYKRTERMRTVLTAVLDKAKKLSLPELNSLIDTVLPHVYTNISSNEIIALLPQIFSVSIDENIGWPYEVRGITLNLWFGVPVTLEENVTRLHQELFGAEDYIPSDKVKEISRKIINRTGYR